MGYGHSLWVTSSNPCVCVVGGGYGLGATVRLVGLPAKVLIMVPNTMSWLVQCHRLAANSVTLGTTIRVDLAEGTIQPSNLAPAHRSALHCKAL
jgi:hypothetical protein